MKNIYMKVLFLAMLGTFWAACSDMNDLHDKYLQQGETIYLAKFDSIKIYPGAYRARVDYWLTDPKAKQCIVEWNMGESSAAFDVSTTEGGTPNSFYINELEETTISFDFYTCSADKAYFSLKTNVTTTVYGDNYVSTLLNATVTNVVYNNGTLSFKWNANYETVIGYNVKYVDTDGAAQDLRLPVTEDRTVELPKFPNGGSFDYSTIYMPVEGAIDEFPVPYETYSLEDEEDWSLKSSMDASASLEGADWESIDSYMKQYKFEYTEHPNKASEGTDHTNGVHIEVVNDIDLECYVFKFNIHASCDTEGNVLILDGDRGEKEDRQRNEMKSRTGDDRHDVNGNWGEKQRLEWKFKIPAGFRPTKSFTHIHQLKAQEGNNGSPLITITPRASDNNGKNSRIQIIHTGDNSETSKGTIVDNLPLSEFEDEWIQVVTEMLYTHNGSFYIRMERISDGKVLVEERFDNIDMWRKGAIDIRNKFGIYRSYGGNLEEDYGGKFPTSGIKDESLYLADFKIYEKNSNSDPQAHD